MSFELFFVLLIFLSYLLFFKKFKILCEDNTTSIHKKFIKNDKSPILIGGIFLVSVIIFFSEFNFYFVKLPLILIFILGLFSDKHILSNPKLRLFLQLLILLYVVVINDLKIFDLRNNIANIILSYSFLNILFTIFCLAILINGSNFIDGLNGLFIGYSILVLSSLLFIEFNFKKFEIIEYNLIKLLIFSLLILLFFNLFGIIYLGDNGSYLLSFFIGIYLISFFINNPNISPYYIASLLWYPSFENFFSLLRRLILKKNVSKADNSHLHQLFYLYFSKLKIMKKSISLNSFTAMIILTLNIPGFIIANTNPFSTKVQVLVIITNIITYILFYFWLSKKLGNEKSQHLC